MKIKMKRLFGIILSLVLVLGLMPGVSLTAKAAEYTSLSVGDVIKVGDSFTPSDNIIEVATGGGNANMLIAQYGDYPLTLVRANVVEVTDVEGGTTSTVTESETGGYYVFRYRGNRYVTNTEWVVSGKTDGLVLDSIGTYQYYTRTDPLYTFSVHETTVAVTGVSLDKTTTTLTVGDTETLTATVSPDGASNKSVTWSSNNESVATVDANGKVSAVAAGTANITVTATNGTADDTSDDKKATCAVTVNAASSGGGSSDSGSGDSSGNSSSNDSNNDTSNNNNSSNDSGNSNSEPKDEPKAETPYDYLEPLREDLKAEIALGGERTVTWNQGTALPYDIMKTLQDNPGVTLIFSYTYQGIDYKVTISGKDAKAYTEIPWYGPLYLYKHYGSSSETAPANTTDTTTGERTYTVLPGDTLIELAGKLNTTVDTLVSLNDIKNRDFILVGQILKY